MSRKPTTVTLQARQKLANAGMLATDLGIPENIRPASNKDLERWGRQTDGATPVEAIVNEDRGQY